MKINNSMKYFKEGVLKVKYFIVHPYVILARASLAL